MTVADALRQELAAIVRRIQRDDPAHYDALVRAGTEGGDQTSQQNIRYPEDSIPRKEGQA